MHLDGLWHGIILCRIARYYCPDNFHNARKPLIHCAERVGFGLYLVLLNRYVTDSKLP